MGIPGVQGVYGASMDSATAVGRLPQERGTPTAQRKLIPALGIVVSFKSDIYPL